MIINKMPCYKVINIYNEDPTSLTQTGKMYGLTLLQASVLKLGWIEWSHASNKYLFCILVLLTQLFQIKKRNHKKFYTYW